MIALKAGHVAQDLPKVICADRGADPKTCGWVNSSACYAGLDDVSCFAAEADGLLEATNVPGLGVRAVVPARVRLRAVLLELPAQVNPVRAPVGTVSGFDLAEFNRFAR